MAPYRLITGFVAVAALTTFIHCSNKSSKSPTSGKTCSGTQALQSAGVRGSSMDAKTLAFTFDDGPGARTKQLSLYLKNEGIQAAFFVNGQQMGPDAPEILQALVDDGHLVANHTETHRSLTGVATAEPRLTDAEVVKEVTDTDVKIDPFVPSKRFLFRPPYGDFDDTSFAALSGTPMNKYVGPILWDIGDKMDEAAGRAADWDCWQLGNDAKTTPMKTCGDLYVTEIKRAGKGIVLMHDPYFNVDDPEQLGTVDMVMYMVPILKQEGFTFTRVDKVPEIAALLPPLEAESVIDGGTGAPSGPGGTSGGQPSQPDNPCP
jgi:peptidoglycan-N-acetylglucosamine deacetylase